MFINFLRIALRQFTKHKVYTLINIFGLSLGLCCFVLLSLFVNRELSFDEFQSNKESVYQLYVADSANVNGPFSYSTMAPMGPALIEEIPEIINYARFGQGPTTKIVTDNKTFQMKGMYYTDAAAFDLFDIDIIVGSVPKNIFPKKQILLSESEALRFYDDVESAIGQLIEIPDFEKCEVIGVFKDLPENTHLKFNSLISFDHAADLIFYGAGFQIDIDVNKWGALSAFTTYLQLDTESGIEEVKGKIKSTIMSHTKQSEIELVRLDDVYLSEWYSGYFNTPGDRKELNLFIGVGLLLMLIAIVNYMNLSTARFSKRAKEVGIRKTIGGHRNQLVLQFLVESITITFFALVIGVVFAEMAMPYFNNYTGKEIDLNFNLPATYFFLLSTAIIIGLISGIYPAFYLSKFSAKHSLASSNSGKDKSIFRKVLVGTQFAICLGLISATFILFSQHKYMNNMDLGINTDQILVAELKSEKAQKSVESIQNEIRKSTSVDKVKAATISPLSGGSVSMGVSTDVGQINSTFMIVESGLMEMLGVELVEGDLFSGLPESKRAKAVLVNEAFVRKAEWDEPLGKQVLGSNIVVGVVKDFIFESAKKEVAPAVISQSSKSNEYLYVHLTGDVSKGLKDIEKSISTFDSEHEFDYQFLDDVFAAKYEEERRLSEIFGLFSLLTIFIAGLGVLGLSIFIAESRIKEIGIRKVLGAKVGHVVWLLNSGITLLVMIVAIIVLPLVFHFAQGWLDDFAYNIELNVFHFILPLVLLLGILWSILFYQAYKSANANPVNALRME